MFLNQMQFVQRIKLLGNWMSKLNYSYDSLIFTRTSVWRVYVRRYIVSYIDTALARPRISLDPRLESCVFRSIHS